MLSRRLKVLYISYLLGLGKPNRELSPLRLNNSLELTNAVSPTTLAKRRLRLNFNC